MTTIATAEKRNGLNQATHTKALRGAIHDVGIFIRILFTADKVIEIGSQSWIIVVVLFIALVFSAHLSAIRAFDWKSTMYLVKAVARDEAESETSTDNGED